MNRLMNNKIRLLIGYHMRYNKKIKQPLHYVIHNQKDNITCYQALIN